jgi:hypothetical protein
MKFVLPLFCLAAIGCGGNAANNNNVGSGGGHDAGVADQGSGQDSSTGSAHCDITQQTGCAAGQKCIPDYTNSNQQHPDPVGKCVADGTAEEGQACQITSQQMDAFINDTCKGGLICDNDGPGSTLACHKVCTADSLCAGGSQCAGFLYASKWGICISTCTPSLTNPQGNNCPTGNSCAANFGDVGATQAMPSGFFACKKDGAAKALDACNTDSDCGAGLYCDVSAGFCQPLCGASQACPTLPPSDGGTLTQQCQMFSNNNTVGACFAM